MVWAYYLAGWLFVGFLVVSICLYDGYRKGDNLTLGDLGDVFTATLAGPIFVIWLLRELAKENASMVLVKGHKSCDK